MTLTDNVNRDHWCDYCANMGWVTLRGTVTEMGHTYTRGSTPCRWCLRGVAAFKPYIERPPHEQPISDYTEADVEPAGPRPTNRLDPDYRIKLNECLRTISSGTPIINPPPWIALERRIEEQRQERLEAEVAAAEDDIPLIPGATT